MFLSQQRAADQIPVITGLLERWRNAVPGFTDEMRKAASEVVERLVIATRLRYPVVGDLARSIRYEAYERPLIDRDPATGPCRHPRQTRTAGRPSHRAPIRAATSRPWWQLPNR